MGIWQRYMRNCTQYYCTAAERNALAGLIVLFSLIATFNQWGDETFRATTGLYNFGWSLLTIGISFLIVDGARRLWAIAFGMRYQLQVLWYPLGASIVLTMLSGGALKPYLGATYWLEDLPGQRGTRHYRRVAIADFAYVGLLGVLVHFLLANLGILGFFDLLPTVAVQNMIGFNLIYATLSLLPIPPLDGSKMLYWFFGTTGGWYSLPAILLGILTGFGLGWIFGATLVGSYCLALLGGIAILTYWERLLPHPK